MLKVLDCLALVLAKSGFMSDLEAVPQRFNGTPTAAADPAYYHDWQIDPRARQGQMEPRASQVS